MQNAGLTDSTVSHIPDQPHTRQKFPHVMPCWAGWLLRPTAPGLALMHLHSHAQSNKAVQAGSMLRLLGTGH
eukprot:scaffold226417_cov23-Tisochrysis_lutea.AAC.1